MTAAHTMKAIALSTFENATEGLVRRGELLSDLDARRFKALQQAGLVDEEAPGRKKLEAAQVIPQRSSTGGEKQGQAPSNKVAQEPQNKGRRGAGNGGGS